MNRLSIPASIFSDVDSDFAIHTCRSRCLPFQLKMYTIFFPDVDLFPTKQRRLLCYFCTKLLNSQV
jgi:hypothetical protein